MKPIIAFLLLAVAVTSSAAIPSAVVLPQAEIWQRQIAWSRANPSGKVLTMTSLPEYGSGNSMRPALQPKDWMFYEAYVGQKLKKQAVLVSLSHCKIPITHFVYDETKTHIYLTGINNRRSDGWIPKTKVMGVLVGVLRPE